MRDESGIQLSQNGAKSTFIATAMTRICSSSQARSQDPATFLNRAVTVTKILLEDMHSFSLFVFLAVNTSL
jgi:hypothetical protein